MFKVINDNIIYDITDYEPDNEIEKYNDDKTDTDDIYGEILN